jgi:simple sugar transport system substrate-binding protein
MKRSIISIGIALALTTAATTSYADSKLRINMVVHSASTNGFWQSVKRGMDDACKLYHADCQFLFAQKEGDTANQLRNFQTSVAQKVDAIVVSITDDKAYNQPVADAISKGITVLAFNVDDTEGALGNKRQAFIGQSFIGAGSALEKSMEQYFPQSGPIHVLIGISAPGQNWSEARGKGVMKALDEFKEKNPSRPLTYERIDSGTDLNITSERVMAYINKNPATNAYFDTGFWEAGVAQALKSKGVAAGKVTLAGFDLVPAVLDRIEDGYIQGTVDQQPYLQGYLPVVQAALMKQYKLSAWDVNTGNSIITKKDIPAVRELAKQGIR